MAKKSGQEVADSRRPKPVGKGYALLDLPGKANVFLGDPDRFGGSKVGPFARAEKWRPYGTGEPACWLDVQAADVEPDVAAERIVSIQRLLHGQLTDVDALEMECVRGRGGRGGRGGRPTGEIHRMFGGLFGWEIEWDSLNAMPVDRIDIENETYVPVVFTLDFPAELSWHYQPSLTQEEIDGGFERPDDVVGSFAVYWNQEGRYLRGGRERVNYETGKFCHLYRPQLTDSNGDTCWAIVALQGDPGSVQLVVYIPLTWLLAAVFPVILDPDFGYDTMGGSSYSYQYYLGNLLTYSPGTDGSVQSITCGFQRNGNYDTHTVTYGLYDDSTPWNLLADTGGDFFSYPDTTPTWRECTLDAPYDVFAANSYRLASLQLGERPNYRFDSLGGSNYASRPGTGSGSGSSGNMPDPWVHNVPSGGNGVKMSIFATYIEGGDAMIAGSGSGSDVTVSGSGSGTGGMITGAS